ncbi:Uncharacterized protein OBRU01_00781 [Operophtera brumata]|uniref:beta-N-acetylhexosaminidase n=1 Tax=Operophtera brumata TaxID=104452 RepID=A0A0L7LUX1_OPEBR|nr:Uncharacterized protein OBRU01_00781 [Operophtera brumata]
MSTFDLVDVPAEARELVVEMSRLVGPSLHAECGGSVTEVVETPIVVYIYVKSSLLSLDWSTDEQYALDVQTKEDGVQVRISAETVYGARHALETFTQLAAADRPDFSDQTQCSLRLVSGAKIRDHPAYKHRGFVLDSSRHFIPMKDIKRTIDGMAATKMNVFHWHVTDSHSFPLESTRVPQFTRYGAYSPSEIYSTEEVRELVKYAQIRGVRMVIEIDSPAHAGNGWQWGKLNPANPAVYRVLKDLYRDIAELLPKPALLHVGGDEVFFPCWNSSEEITNYMEGKGFDTSTTDGFIKLWGEFHEKSLQLWDGEAVSVPKDIWYLDHGFWGMTTYSNWRKMYAHLLPKENGMLGGEVAMWSEYVDEQDLDTRVWPRAAAVAERLWSDPITSVYTAEPRLQRMRGRLINRGLRPDAISPAWCSQHDGRCL